MTEQPEILDEIEWPEVENVEFDVIATVRDVTSIGEGLDILAATLGRFGIDGFAIQMRDSDNPDRTWILRDGRLYTTEEFIGEFEYLADRARDEDQGIEDPVLTPEEIEAIEKADAPADRQ